MCRSSKSSESTSLTAQRGSNPCRGTCTSKASSPSIAVVRSSPRAFLFRRRSGRIVSLHRWRPDSWVPSKAKDPQLDNLRVFARLMRDTAHTYRSLDCTPVELNSTVPPYDAGDLGGSWYRVGRTDRSWSLWRGRLGEISGLGCNLNAVLLHRAVLFGWQGRAG